MQVTRATEYAIRGLVLLGDGQRKNGHVRFMAENLDLPESFLAKIFSSMAKAGIVLSRRGQHGGYRMGMKPDKISLKMVIEAVEGPFALTRCLRPVPACSAKGCAVKQFFSLAQERMAEVLDSVTIADVVRQAADKAPQKDR